MTVQSVMNNMAAGYNLYFVSFLLLPLQPGILSSELASAVHTVGHAVAHLVEALCYKSEGRGFDSRWCQWNFSLKILPAALWPWG